MLELYPDVHGRHYKLWLASRVVLDRVLHNASVNQSEFDVERVYRDIRRYVRSAAYPRAVDMLNANHVAIISGAPGVGKTSLAKMLLYAHLERGYEVISILTDFQTGRERYQPGKPQIFYFDDFIGATFLGERASAFTRNEDRAILDFIELVRTSPTARLVMTTREHILRQAIAASEKLKQSRLIDDRCVLEIGDYSRRQRAEILYNHIYFSDLPDAYCDALLADRFYKEIVEHQKFNPRLIDWLSNFQRVKVYPATQYQQFVRNLLADPAEIWRYAYDHQISDAARSVLLALYTYSGKCGPTVLEEAFRSLQSLRSRRYGFRTSPSDWRAALSELSGSFIRPGNQIEVIDPSALDMLNAVVRQDTANALDMIEGATRFEQLRRVWNVAHGPGNELVLRYLATEQQRLISAITRLLAAPHAIPFGTGRAFIDDSHEMRLATALEIAETLKARDLRPIVAAGLEALLSGWETEHPDLIEAVTLLNKIALSARSAFVFGSATESLVKRIQHGLAIEAAAGCRSDELREVLSVIEPEDMTSEISDRLRSAGQFYRLHRFRDELRECKSASDFDSLDEDLVTIAERLQIDLEGPLHAILEAKAEFEDHQSAYEDQKYEEWKESRHDMRSSDRMLDDMFDSLRKTE